MSFTSISLLQILTQYSIQDADKLPVATIKWEIVFESTWKIVHTSKELFTGTEREDYFNETKVFLRDYRCLQA